MSEINIERNHALGAAEARNRIGRIEGKLSESYGVKLDWNGNTASIKGTGVSGTLVVEDARVTVKIKLGLLLRPLAGTVKEGLEKQLTKGLA